MPRPKVKPQDRQRSAKACDPCKVSKKRCDGSQPCRLCLKKGTVSTCIYTPTARDRRKRHSGRAAPESPADFGSTIPSPAQRASQSPRQRERGYVGHQHLPAPQEEDDAESETEPALGSRNSLDRSAPKPTMLYSSGGDKVFVGNTASLSFLRFLQKTLKHYAGPSGFTDRQHSHKWFEATGSDISGAAFSDDLSEDEKDQLIRSFMDASSGLLDLYAQEDLKQLIADVGNAGDITGHSASSSHSQTRPLDIAAIASYYLMIAIGCQVRGRSSSDDLVQASKYFARGRQIAFEKMLEDPTINLVRAFILLAFYMLGACRRNSAFMYLGVAAKSADILGLYAAARNRGRDTPKHEQDARLRVARSVRVFDVVCSSILGRRGSAPLLRSLDSTPGDIDEAPSTGSHRALALRATYESCSILDAVVGRFADDGCLSTSSAEHFLQLLRDWSQALPVALRQRPRCEDVSAQDDPQYQENMIANIHVAGTYYFGIILVTRQFLIQHTMPQLRGRTTKAKDIDSPNLAPLSRACIGAAIYMARMCREAVDAHIFLGNMIIIKAWVFAAGLVLGFALLCEESANAEARDAFQGAQQVLSVLGRLSPQAEQYKKILGAFSDAIDNYRRQLRREHDESGVPYVEQILSYDTSPSTSRYGATAVCTQNVETGSSFEQLPTPNLHLDDLTADDAGFSTWNGSDSLSSMTMSSDFQWPTPSDNELMLRILWEGYSMNFDEPLQYAAPSAGGMEAS